MSACVWVCDCECVNVYLRICVCLILWAQFDLLVVSISLISLVFDEVPGIKSLRIMRAFRVMR